MTLCLDGSVALKRALPQEGREEVSPCCLRKKFPRCFSGSRGDHGSEWQQARAAMAGYASVNVAKIPKVVYLLLEKYHRTFGLGVVGWSKQPANHYFSFYCLGVRDENGRPLQLPDSSGGMSLTIYQDSIGLPEWGAGRQWAHPEAEKRELRTGELLEWYEERLDLRRFFEEHSQQIRAWRHAYHVSQSEPYLLTWNVLGLFTAKTASLIYTHARSEYYGGVTDSEKIAVAELGVAEPWESVHFCNDLAFSTAGRVRLPDGEQVHIWEKRLRGQSAEAIAAELLDRGGRRPG